MSIAPPVSPGVVQQHVRTVRYPPMNRRPAASPCVPLTDDEQAAVYDGQAALDHLLERLADTPTPAVPPAAARRSDDRDPAADRRRHWWAHWSWRRPADPPGEEWVVMELRMELDLGDLRLRTLTTKDAALLVEATRAASAPALWGPRPAGPYSLAAARSALGAWDPHRHRQVSFGVLQGARLVAALGLILDGPHSAELAYWVRPEQRRRGIALRSVQALTAWAHTTAGLTRVWLEIDPDNTPSLQLARRAGYHLEQRLPRHCRAWSSDDPEHDTWHDCLIWVHTT